MSAIRKALAVFPVLVMFPAVLAHEATHALTALPFGRVEKFSLVPPQAVMWYPSGTPMLAVRAANLAPTILGLLVGLPLLTVVLDAGLSPVPLAYAVGSWALYTVPSPEDIQASVVSASS